jgi:hypothetical protein
MDSKRHRRKCQLQQTKACVYDTGARERAQGLQIQTNNTRFPPVWSAVYAPAISPRPPLPIFSPPGVDRGPAPAVVLPVRHSGHQRRQLEPQVRVCWGAWLSTLSALLLLIKGGVDEAHEPWPWRGACHASSWPLPAAAVLQSAIAAPIVIFCPQSCTRTCTLFAAT